MAELRAAGLTPPRLYALGFSHNNCGGACVKAGQGHWANLLRALPEVYASAEREEAALREQLGDVAILATEKGCNAGGPKRRLTLAEFRESITADQEHDAMEIGGCGCFVE